MLFRSYAHTEGDCGTDHRRVAVDEPALGYGAGSGTETGMIAHCPMAAALQFGCHSFRSGARQAVDYARIIGITLYQTFYRGDTPRFSGILSDTEAYIRAIERTGVDHRPDEPELSGDIVARQSVGSGSQRYHGHRRVNMFDTRKFGIDRPEIMSPLRYAVRLIDRKQADLESATPTLEIEQEALGRHIEQFDAAFSEPVDYLTAIRFREI